MQGPPARNSGEEEVGMTQEGLLRELQDIMTESAAQVRSDTGEKNRAVNG